jgi:hypothetical protein
MTRTVDDLKSALVLSLSFAVAAAATVPLLLPSLPPEARELPLSVPLFSVALAIQMTVVYGLAGLGGLRLARSSGLEPAPLLTALSTGQALDVRRHGFGNALALGLGCGTALVALVAAIKQLFPSTLPTSLHPPGLAAALLASTAASFGEEILFRLLLVSLLLYTLPAGRWRTALAVGIAAIVFGAAHAPAFVFLFGGWHDVPPVAWIWLLALNGLCGATYGAIYVRRGIESAVLAHLATDVVWHVASQALH